MQPITNMPCTFNVGSDCYPGKVVAVLSPRRIMVQRVRYRAGEGHNYFGSQKWEILDEPEGEEREYTLRKNGRWVAKGAKHSDLSLGHARAYQDPSF